METQYQPSFRVVQDAFSQIREMVRMQMRGAAMAMITDLFTEEVEELCGPRHSRKSGNKKHRGGSDPGSVLLGGQRMSVRKPRVKCDGQEVELVSHTALQDYDMLCDRVMKHMIAGVSTRDYDGLLEDMENGLGLKKSSVSKAFVKSSKEHLESINGRDLSEREFCAILIDGIGFGDRMVIVALGIQTNGKKLVLGLREGNTENGDICRDLLESLKERGLESRSPILFVIDGSKALRSGIRRSFGKHHPVQRCTLHKLRNLMEYTPKEHYAELHRRWKRLHGCVDYAVAKREYAALAQWLGQINHQALASLEESELETLTVIKLKVPGKLKRSLHSTNPIESLFGRVSAKTNRVKNWKSSPDQVSRWAATTLLDAEKSFRKVFGWRDIPVLLAELKKGIELDAQTA